MASSDDDGFALSTVVVDKLMGSTSSQLSLLLNDGGVFFLLVNGFLVILMDNWFFVDLLDHWPFR